MQDFLPLERPSDVFSYTSFRGSFFKPRLHSRFETAIHLPRPNQNMLGTIDTGSPNVIAFELSGKRRDGDYTQLVQMMKTVLIAERTLRLFVKYEDFPGWDAYAAWDDFKLNLPHNRDFQRIAVVGEKKWEKLMASFCEPFTKAEVKYFDKREVDAAWKWLRETDEGDKASVEKAHSTDTADNTEI